MKVFEPGNILSTTMCVHKTVLYIGDILGNMHAFDYVSGKYKTWNLFKS